MTDIGTIRQNAKLLNLQNLASGRIDLNYTGQENITFLQDILEQELTLRKEKKTYKTLKDSCLPNKKFNFENLPKVTVWQIEKLLEFEWLEHGDNLLLFGNCNSGKTCLMSYIGRKAIEQGFKTYYLTIENILNKNKKIDNKLKDSDLINNN